MYLNTLKLFPSAQERYEYLKQAYYSHALTGFNLFWHTVKLFPSAPELDENLEKLNKEQKEQQTSMEYWRGQEKEIQDKLSDDSKELDKMTNKQSVLLRKVCSTSLSSLGRYGKPVCPPYKVWQTSLSS